MSVKATRVVKFIRQGDKGTDAVRYWLIPSVTSVTLYNVESGDGTPAPSAVSCRLVKQVGEDTPTTIATPSSVGLSIFFNLTRNGINSTMQSYSGYAINVPTNTEFTAINFYLYQGSQLLDTQTVAIVCDGEKGDKGDPGNDGVTIQITPQNLVLKAGAAKAVDVYVDLFKGGVRQTYQDSTFICSTLTDSEVLKWSFRVEDGRFRYYFIYNGKACSPYEIDFTVTFEGKQYAQKIYVSTVADGDTGPKGDRGPALRGPQAWSDCANGYNFQAGGDSEAYKDVVLYNGNYYSCVKSHTKTTSNYPGSTTDTNNGYWQLGDKVELIATKILLASYALVKNLGVESIDMKDANGNVLFQAKDGNVTCKTGTFDGITVRNAKIESGDIAGFKVSGTGLTNSPFTNDAYIIFRNDAQGAFAGIGGNVLPVSSGARAVARFENEDSTDHWGLGRNIAMILSAKNGAYNHAFTGSGNGTLNGWIGGYLYSKFSCTTANTIYNGYVTLKTNNKWIITSSVSGSGIVLPTLTEVRSALGISSTTPFCVEFTVLADLLSNDFYIYGRNSLKDSSSNTPWNTEEIPVLAHWNNGRDDRMAMGAGDCERFLLIYDPNKTGTLNDYSLKYTARRINHQA